MKKARYYIKHIFLEAGTETGFSLVEVLLAISLLLMVTTGIISVVAYAQDVRGSARDRPYAVSLAEEAIEVVRGLRVVLASEVPDGTYAIERSGTGWALVDGQEVIAGKYAREVSISTVSGAVKQVDATVSWVSQYGADRSVVLSTLLSDWQSAAGGRWFFPVLESTLDLPGNENGIKIVADGEFGYAIKDRGDGSLVLLDFADVSAPQVSGIADVDGLPRGLALAAEYVYLASVERNREFQVYSVADPALPVLVDSHDPSDRQAGLSVTVDGNFAYLGREVGKGQELWIYDISDPEQVFVSGILDLDGSVEDSVRFGDYLAVASDDRNQEVVIVDVSDPGSPTVAAGYDLPGNSVALSCALLGENLIVGLGTGDVYVLDVSDPSAITEAGIYDAGSDVRDISVDEEDSVIFLATDENTSELQIVDLSAPAEPSRLGVYDAPADINGVWYDAERDYLYAVGDANGEELMIFSPE